MGKVLVFVFWITIRSGFPYDESQTDDELHSDGRLGPHSEGQRTLGAFTDRPASGSVLAQASDELVDHHVPVRPAFVETERSRRSRHRPLPAPVVSRRPC
jgi:hypothetical protein